MRLALQTDYALRTLLYVATHTGRSTIQQVAEFYGISAHHLGKVAHTLGRLGLVRSLRGPSGGIELSRAPATISVGQVVRAFEGTNVQLLECVGTPGVCVIQPGCILRGVLAEAERRQMAYLDSVTLASILPANRDLKSFRESKPRRRSAVRRVRGSTSK